jgi:hypothetical protein
MATVSQISSKLLYDTWFESPCAHASTIGRGCRQTGADEELEKMLDVEVMPDINDVVCVDVLDDFVYDLVYNLVDECARDLVDDFV